MHNKLISRSVPFFGSVFLALGLLFTAHPVQAGFQWVSPSGSNDLAPIASAPSAAAPAVVSQGFPEPQIIGGGAPPGKWQDTVQHPKSPEKEEPVRGFADNVPLSVALRQVLPQDVGFSVAQDVSLGTLVSWKGGAPWRQVMKSMLLPAGLAIKEQGQVVQVVRATEAQIAAGSAASSLPAVPPARAALPPLAEGKPTALVPSAPASLPVRSIPDHSSPSGTGGVLVPPASSQPALPVSMPAPYVMDKTIDAWTANKGDTLQKVLEGWSQRANVDLSWRAEYDFPLQASVSINGSYEEAVRGLLLGFQDARPQPIGYLYNNQQAGQTVLVVQTRGNNYNE